MSSEAPHLPLRAGSEGAFPDHCPTPKARGPAAPPPQREKWGRDRGELLHRNLRFGRLSALERRPVLRERGITCSTPPCPTLVWPPKSEAEFCAPSIQRDARAWCS